MISMQTGEPGSATDTGQKAESFLLSLRNTTSPEHILLESHPLLSALVSESVSLHQYYAYLFLMHEVALAYEEHILPLTIDYIPYVEDRKASSQIWDDMQYSGYAVAPGLSIRGFTVDLKNLTVPYALGFRYVMEGSRLGGRVIFKHIERSLGFSAQSGASYLAGHGVNTGINWKTFLAHFSASVVAREGEQEAIAGASVAFSSIHDFFRSNRLLYDN
jgi:heme oxygenase